MNDVKIDKLILQVGSGVSEDFADRNAIRICATEQKDVFYTFNGRKKSIEFYNLMNCVEEIDEDLTK